MTASLRLLGATLHAAFTDRVFWIHCGVIGAALMIGEGLTLVAPFDKGIMFVAGVMATLVSFEFVPAPENSVPVSSGGESA